MTRKRRHGLVALVLVLLAAAAVATAVALSGAARTSAAEEIGEAEFPTALARHMEKLKEAAPGNTGMAEEGPGTADEQKWAAMAYPATDISAAKLNGALAAAASLKGKLTRGKGRKGEWVSVGPSQALYPFFPLRNSTNYVPDAYLAASRITSVAIDPSCNPGHCRLWVSPSGGGVWRTKNALSGQPNWEYLSGSFGINTVGSLYLDPNDPSGNTIYAGTGEANACASGCVAGVGLYKSTDGGDTWSGPLGNSSFNNRAIGSIAVKPGSPNVIYAASTRALRGMSSVISGGVVTNVPGAPQWGLYKSTDGGANWTFIHNGANTTACGSFADQIANNGSSPCSPRGVRRVVIDPLNSSILYAGSYARGVWRSTDEGTTWTQIHLPLVSTPAVTTARPELAVTVKSGKTRLYLAEGASGSPTSRAYRTDDAQTATTAVGWVDLTSPSVADDRYGSHNTCTGQCWYDQFVYTPKGQPDVVYLGGSYSYSETGLISNGRGVVLSTNSGASWTDLTMDGTDALHPNGLHPDQHDLVTNPNNPFQFFEVSDGGIMRSSGAFVDRSAWCAPRGISGATLARCQQLLSRVPSELESMNRGIVSLQFMSLSVSPFNSQLLQGGTQDNGTWQTEGNPVKWENTMIGDGGQSGFDAANPAFRFHSFFDTSPEVNFSNGATGDWISVYDPLFGTGGQFYSPIIGDPTVTGTMFAGAANVWRTKTHGLGTMTMAEAQQHCNSWTGDFAVTCGDWQQVATPSLNSSAAPWGAERAGGAVAAVERRANDNTTAWAATTTGRLFISKNVNADPASAVAWTRLDTLATNDPNRFISGIYPDPGNVNRAYVSYTGFDASTPTTPGHVFRVEYNPGAGTATWTDLSADLGDQPINDIVLDPPTGDLYVSSDFGVYSRGNGASGWKPAATGLPSIAVAGLTIVPADRILYAATHAMGAWRLNLG
jgi:hypothetical protein